MTQVSYKICMLGNSGVGKTTLVKRFKNNTQGCGSPTISADLEIASLEVDGVKYKLIIWDTAGQEQYRAFIRNFYRNVNGIVLVYEVVDEEAVSHLQEWFHEISMNCMDSPKVILAGNKCDLPFESKLVRQVIEFADDIKSTHFQTSAFTGENVYEVFEKLVREIVTKTEEPYKFVKVVPETPETPEIERSKFGNCCG